MPIAQLSNETIQYLRSTVVLNDASSVVKELIENALDSHATTINIEVSANALDVIQVRDNGTGIGIEDRQLLCKRGCTSKIRTLHDLENLGGRTLGFRGEALSSIADLSEHICITTRVAGEVVGTALTFGPGGKLLSSTSASHAVGTTLKIQKFLSQVPVRRQFASKSSTKVLASLKKLLFNYAFVQPGVRFSLKVLKRDHDKNSWSFAPEEHPDQLLAAAIKILGKEVATQCTTYSASMPDADGTLYSARALLLNPDADGVALGSSGQYIAVDGRPVTAERGTMREMSKLYRQCLQHSVGKERKAHSKPLFVLQVICPRGSYDVNIEPAKDEVLFHRKEKIIELGQMLFTQAYGEIPYDKPLTEQSKENPADPVAPSFNILLARKKPNQHIVSIEPSEHEQPARDRLGQTASLDLTHDTPDLMAAHSSSTLQYSPDSTPGISSNIYGDDDMNETGLQSQEIESSPNAGTAFEEELASSADNMVRNPFTTAALHARLRPKDVTGASWSSSANKISKTPYQMDDNSSPLKSALSIHPPSTSRPYLPTPSRSPTRVEPYQNPGPPPPPWSRREHLVEEDDEAMDNAASRLQQEAINKWMQPSHKHQDSIKIPARSPLTLENVGLGSNIPGGTQHLNDHRSYKPFKSPTKSSVLSIPTITPSRSEVQTNLSMTDLSELDEIMDFEHRKKAINQRPKRPDRSLNPAELARLQHDVMKSTQTTLLSLRDTDIPSSQGTLCSATSNQHSSKSIHSSPHKNRYEAALRNLEHPQFRQTSLINGSADSARLYLQSEQSTPNLHLPWPRPAPVPSTSISNKHQLKKARSLNLPLETIPKADIKHNIQYTNAITLSTVSSATQNLSKHDTYIRKGTIETTEWSPFSRYIPKWQSRLEDLVRENYRHGQSQCDNDVEDILDQDEDSSEKVGIKTDLMLCIKNHLAMLELENQE